MDREIKVNFGMESINHSIGMGMEID